MLFFRMNSKLQTPKYGEKALKLQFTNSIVGIHDLICGCEKPLQHSRELLQEEENKNTTCLSTSAAVGDPTEDILDGGTLEDLFAEELTEEG